MSIPDDTMERKKWMLQLWQEYSDRFAVFHPDEQPLPSVDVWRSDIIFGQGPKALAIEIPDSWKERGQSGPVDETQAQDCIDAFFGTFRRVLPYFNEEYGRLTEPGVSERVLNNPVTGRIRRFHKERAVSLRGG